MSSAVFSGGRLTDADKARIQVLFGRKLGAHLIAKDIGRRSSAVQWFLYREGLAAPKPSGEPLQYLRNGRTVRRYGATEDAFITALRLQGYSFAEIARHASTRFGTERTAHSIHCRLIMLAAALEETA